MARTHIGEEFGVTYKYQFVAGAKYIVFTCKKDYESYFMGSDRVIPELFETWRDAPEASWTVADDGGVVQVLRRRQVARGKNRYYLRTVVGTFLTDKKVFMDTDFSKHVNRYAFSGKANPAKISRCRDRDYLTKKEFLFALAVATGWDIYSAYRKAFGYDGLKVNEKAWLLVKKKRIMEAIMDSSLSDRLKEKGLNYNWVLDGVKNIAEKSKRDDVRLNAYLWVGKALEEAEGIDTGKLFGRDIPVALEKLERPELPGVVDTTDAAIEDITIESIEEEK